MDGGKFKGSKAVPLSKAKKDGAANVFVCLTDEQFAKSNLNSSKKKNKVNPTNTTKQRTVWYYHLLGNVKVPEICIYSIVNACKYNDDGCERLHAKCTLQWQFKRDDDWYNFREFHSKELEDSFRDAKNDYTVLSKLDLEKLDKSTQKMAVVLGSGIWVADFISMTIENLDTTDILDIRRLSTHSSAISRSKRATVFDWYYRDDSGNWVKYDDLDSSSGVSSASIEAKYCTDSSSFKFTINDEKWVINFRKMTATTASSDEETPVRRRPGHFNNTFESGDTDVAPSDNFPPHWTPMSDDCVVDKIQLDPSSKEYSDICEFLKKSLPDVTIAQINRYQNPHLWVAYKNKSAFIAKKNKCNDVDELYLFHGTNPDNIKNIVFQNLDWRLHGSNFGHKYGNGAYFTSSARFADNYSVPAPGRAKVLLLVKVLIGRCTAGAMGMVRPPGDPSTGGLYDTTVDNVTAPKVFVKFNDQEYYPEYSIHYYTL